MDRAAPMIALLPQGTGRTRPKSRRQLRQRTSQGLAHGSRESLEVAPDVVAEEMTAVAAKQLVAAVAGQRDLDLGPGELADEEGGYLGRIRERLVIDRRQARIDVPRVRRRDIMVM